MRWLILFCSVILSSHCGIIKEEEGWRSLIEEVNSAGTTWQAEENDYTEYSSSPPEFMLGALLNEKDNIPYKHEDDFRDMRVPEEFDSRKQWPYCKSIFHVRDQANCGSCWAVSAASSLSDRFCIASKGKVQTILSMEDLLSCCNDCGYGCEGGFLGKAWNHFKTEGVVSGGDFDSHEGCMPYSIRPCVPSNSTSGKRCKFIGDENTPSCEKRCTNSRHYRHFNDDHHKVTEYYRLDNVSAIQQEIFDHGPVQASFKVYKDFYTYKSGIYKHINGSYTGGHAIKIIGWGVENNVPFWTISNSWSPKWGENGFFRIVRGVNECSIESNIVAGIPDLKHLKKEKKWYTQR